MNVLTCDKCNKDFILDMKTKTFPARGIEVLYFDCPHCKERNVAVVTDVLTRKQQERIRNLNKQVIKLKQDMQKRMFELKEEIKKEEF